MRASGGRRRRGGTKDDGFWSAFAATSEAERLQALTMQQNTGIQLLLKILQERKKADGAVWRGVAALRTGWRGGRTSAPRPAGWRRP